MFLVIEKRTFIGIDGPNDKAEIYACFETDEQIEKRRQDANEGCSELIEMQPEFLQEECGLKHYPDNIWFAIPIVGEKIPKITPAQMTMLHKFFERKIPNN